MEPGRNGPFDSSYIAMTMTESERVIEASSTSQTQLIREGSYCLYLSGEVLNRS